MITIPKLDTVNAIGFIKQNNNKYYKGFEICEKLTVYHCGHVYASDGRCIAEVAAHKALDK